MNVVVAKGDVISAYGLGMDALWNGLMSGKTAIKSTDIFAERSFVSDQAALIPNLEAWPTESRIWSMLTRLLSPLATTIDRQTPLMLATTVGAIEYTERGVIDEAPDLLRQSNPRLLLMQLKSILGLSGPAWVVSSACASSSAALSRAAAMVQSGSAPAVLIVAADAISEFVYAGFSTLASLCETPARPFDSQHCGLTLGEAAAWVLVTPDTHPAAKDPLFTILGWASATDAVHMTAPDRNAGGLTSAIRSACAMAECDPGELRLVAAHGTATPYNDSMEMLALRNTIGKPIPTFSVKGGVGHTLGSAGLLQILVAARAMKERRVPPTVGLTAPDTDSSGWVSPAAVPLTGEPTALSTSSGFGGVNTAIVFSQILRAKKSVITVSASVAAIEAVGWAVNGNRGSKGIHGLRCECGVPSTQEAMTQFIGRPVKYFSRMTTDAKLTLVAAKLALEACERPQSISRRIGLLAGTIYPTLAANANYFRDYISNGRSMARANLFIYTLPTSTMGEVAIALGMTGPTLFMQPYAAPNNFLLIQAKQMVENGEADGMLVFWSDEKSAVCFVVGTSGRGNVLSEADLERSPLELATTLAEAKLTE